LTTFILQNQNVFFSRECAVWKLLEDLEDVSCLYGLYNPGFILSRQQDNTGCFFMPGLNSLKWFEITNR